MATISIDGTVCKSDKHEPIVIKQVNGKDGQLQPMATFSVAVYQRKDREGKSEYGYWKCTAFGALANNIYNGLKAGDLVTVTGEPRIEKWFKESGEEVITPAILVAAAGRGISRFAPRHQQAPAQYGGYQQQAPAQYGYEQDVQQAMAAVQAARQQPAQMQQVQQGFQQLQQAYPQAPQSMQQPEEFPFDFSTVPTNDGSEVKLPF